MTNSVDYADDVTTKEHCLVLASYLEGRPIVNPGWPVADLGVVLPSARTMIVTALRKLADDLPQS